MKKTRVLAVLLYVMMVRTVIPMLASATGTTYDSMEDVLDFDVITEVELDFDSGSFSPTLSSNFTLGTGMTYDATNGMTINGGYFRYTPGSYYTPIIPGMRVLFFTAKVAEGQTMEAFFQKPTGVDNGRASFKYTTTGIVMNYGTEQTYTSDFAPGTDWVDYL